MFQEEIIVPQKFFNCPLCKELFSSSYSHLLPSNKFGPWGCDNCGCLVSGIVEKNGVTLSVDKSHKRYQLLSLIRIGDESQKAYLVYQNFCDFNFQESIVNQLAKYQHIRDYYINETTCPSNILKSSIIVGDDSDPHGYLTHIETILMPDCFDIHSYQTDEIFKLFPKYKNAI